MSRLTGQSDVSPCHAPITRRVAPVFLRPVVQELIRLGVDPTSLCQDRAFSVSDLDVPDFLMTHQEATSFLRSALTLIGNPHLGLELGMRSNILNRGVLALGFLASETLGKAVALKLRFPARAGLLLAVEAQFLGEQHALIADSMLGNQDLMPFLVDKLFAGFVRLGRQVASDRYAPSRVELVRPKPSNVRAYEEHFRCPVQFSYARNRLMSNATWFNMPLPTASPTSLRLATEILQRETESVGREPGLAFLVHRAIRRALPKLLHVTEVAHSLHLSERTLRRRLEEEGLSYQSLLDETRRDRALELLMHTNTSLSRVAAETGFSDLRTFRRAFKRWSGLTPSQVRNTT